MNDFAPKTRVKVKRKSMVWDVLTVLVLLSICALAGLFLSIFVNPDILPSSFRPAALPTLVQIPTPTVTTIALPATWTPAPTLTPLPTRTKAPTWTLVPVVVNPTITTTAAVTPIVYTPTIAATAVPTTSTPLSFAVIGDFGTGNQDEADVAKLVHSWAPDIVITVGDDNYPLGSAETIDEHIGKDYHDFIFPYTGEYGQGATENRFFPTLGNHDWYTAGAQPYLDYFSLPGNERYYNFTWGPVHFFALDSDENEPDGVSMTSLQAVRLELGLAASTSPWNIVYFHHPPYSSGNTHGSAMWMRWPFAAWGANAVLSGHEHNYERLQVDGIPYFVDGLGGNEIYGFGDPIPQSQFRYHDDYGAMLVHATGTDLHFEFYNRRGTLIDQYELKKP